MNEQVNQMIDSLETPGNRLKTGLLLLPTAQLAKVDEVAARLLAEVEDIAQMALQAVPTGSRYANLSASRIEEWLNAISQKTTGQRRALVVNLDLLLSGVSEAERADVWRYVLFSMPYRPRVLLVAMPETAEHLLPKVEEWEAAGRCARL